MGTRGHRKAHPARVGTARTPRTPPRAHDEEVLQPASWTHTLGEVTRRLGAETPPCVLCARARGDERRLRHLTHGISVWLCDLHGGEEFLRRDAGRVFVHRLARVWVAAGALTSRRAEALHAHIRQTRAAGQAAELPGSYAWPELRAEAERRYESGEDPAVVIRELRGRYPTGGGMRPPSVRTMRRWLYQARWISAPARPWTAIARWLDDRAWVPHPYLLLPQAMLDVLPILYPGLAPRAP